MSWGGTREEEMSVNFLCVLDVSLMTRKGPRLNMLGTHELSVYITVLPKHPVRVQRVGSGLAWDDPSSPVLCLISRITPGARRENSCS